MPTLDPRFRTDAHTAASLMAGGSSTPEQDRGVLAQYIAESGWSYPPRRNNPGNNALGAAAATGYPFKIYGTGTPPAGYTWSGPDPYTSDGSNPNGNRNPIVTYPDEATGVAAYATTYLVIRGAGDAPNYEVALERFRANDVVGWVKAAIAEGYGTSFELWSNVYGLLIAEDPAAPAEWRNEMIYTGGVIPATNERYPITNGMRLYAGTEIGPDGNPTQYLKSFSGTGGNARFCGPTGPRSAATWDWGAVIIGTAAADPAGTIVYIWRPDRAKVVKSVATDLKYHLRPAQPGEDTL